MRRAHIVVGEVVEGGVAARRVDGSRHVGQLQLAVYRRPRRKFRKAERRTGKIDNSSGDTRVQILVELGSGSLQNGMDKRGWQQGNADAREDPDLLARQASASREGAVGLGSATWSSVCIR